MNHAQKTFNYFTPEARSALSFIQKQGPLSKNDLSLLTNVKLSTLNRIIAPLEDRGILIESGMGESLGGRRPILYDINPDLFYVLGIDISRIHTQIVITNLKMDILYHDSFMMSDDFSPDQTVKTIAYMIHNALDQLSISKDMILGAGLGTVGPLDRQKGILLNPINFRNTTWAHAPIKKLLEKALDLPITMDNGANTAVLAEYLYGVGKNYTNIAYVNCSIGIRTGVISSGSVVRTLNDAEDAFGHMIIDMDGKTCQCGNYGCVECYSSIPGIVHDFTSAIKKGRNSMIHKPLDEITYIDICNAAEEKDELAREILLNAATVLGIGLVNYIHLLNPNILILGGSLIRHSPLFYHTCIHTIKKRNRIGETDSITFIQEGFFKEQAMAVGAAAFIVEELLQNSSPNNIGGYHGSI